MALRTEHCCYEWDDGQDPEFNERSPARPYANLKLFYKRDYDIVAEWCQENGYTDLHYVPDAPNVLWAYPPAGVMAEPIDMNEIRRWEREKA